MRRGYMPFYKPQDLYIQCPAQSDAWQLTRQVAGGGSVRISWSGSVVKTARQSGHNDAKFAQHVATNSSSCPANALLDSDCLKAW